MLQQARQRGQLSLPASEARHGGRELAGDNWCRRDKRSTRWFRPSRRAACADAGPCYPGEQQAVRTYQPERIGQQRHRPPVRPGSLAPFNISYRPRTQPAQPGQLLLRQPGDQPVSTQQLTESAAPPGLDAHPVLPHSPQAPRAMGKFATSSV